MHDDDDDSDWSRTEWARWWLDRGDVDSAAEWLRPGDEVRSSAEEFAALSEAVANRGMRALHDEGVAFVFSPEEAARLEDLAGRMNAPAADRLAPARTTPAPRRKIA